MHTKLLGLRGQLVLLRHRGRALAYAYLGTVEPEAYNLDLSFRILFMIIIGGVGSVLGAFLGSAFIVLLPIFLNSACFARADGHWRFRSPSRRTSS